MGLKHGAWISIDEEEFYCYKGQKVITKTYSRVHPYPRKLMKIGFRADGGYKLDNLIIIKIGYMDGTEKEDFVDRQYDGEKEEYHGSTFIDGNQLLVVTVGFDGEEKRINEKFAKRFEEARSAPERDEMTYEEIPDV